MTATLAARLGELATQGTPITFTALAVPSEVVATEAGPTAAGPMAPLLAEAIVDAFERADTPWTDAAAAFPQALAGQVSFLHLTTTLQTLLSSPAATGAWAKPLNTTLLADLPTAVQTTPLVAAARLEGAVRLAASQAVSPYRVWEALDELPLDGPEDFLERMPRLLGVALDCWSDQEPVAGTVRGLLRRLADDEATDADAWFELGCDHLRTALSSTDLDQVALQIAQARKLFANTAATIEARQDADAYTALCDALLGFTAGSAAQVAQAADALDRALDQQAAWLRGTHQAPWLQPRRAAEAAWSHLLIQLRSASELLEQPVWMNAWRALDCVLDAYRASRTVRPVGTGDDLTGLAALIEPAIEDGFLRQHSLLAVLRHAADHPSEHPSVGLDTATAAAVLARIDARTTRTPGSDGSHEAEEADEEPPGGEPARLHRLAPVFTMTLGPQEAVRIGAQLDDQALAAVEALAYTHDVARLQATDPVVIPTLDRILQQLSAHPHFTGEVRTTFTALVTQTLLFLKSRTDMTRSNLFGPGKKVPGSKKSEPPYDYRRKPEPGQREPLEGDLQRDFHGWLQSGPLHNTVQVESVDIGMGRADVLVHFGALRYLTEIKKDDTDNTRGYLENHYLKQASEYTNTNAPFGQLLVLDLTAKTTGTRRLEELTWITTHRPDGALIDRAVVAGIVSGQRVTPAGYSR
ncbi:hypothetical protein ACFV6D_25095 [Kitasatospora sp. NPDC059812]|uniref:hypothetical protein n=1 Tax=Kitasatospora sp. NPDC059812 TaxID=3346958 RepID=UPI003661070D